LALGKCCTGFKHSPHGTFLGKIKKQEPLIMA
jgi:hypothetical protein